MKIKTDFVTNSSSTCFILMTEDEFTLDKFLKAVGIDKDSPFQDMFQDIFKIFSDDLQPAREFARNHRWCKGRSFERFVAEIFSENTLQRVKDAEARGMTVYMGDLYSDHGVLECLLCTNCFIIDGQGLIIDATNDGW